MRSYKDDYSFFDENAYFKIALSAVLGDREEQQDCACLEIRGDEGFVAICDGMGGHKGGKRASNRAIDILSETYKDNYGSSNMREAILTSIENADLSIAALTDEEGNRLDAGSTLVCVYLHEKELYWFSAGDSRIYILRDGELLQITRDHNYKNLLNSQLEEGLIDQSEYHKEMIQGEALISFLGINGLSMLDCNSEAFKLKTGDKILLMSDGLYKVLEKSEIGSIIDNFSNTQEALLALELKAKKVAKNSKINRDNTTVSLICIK